MGLVLLANQDGERKPVKEVCIFSMCTAGSCKILDHIRPSSISLPMRLFANHFSGCLSLIFLIKGIANDFREFFKRHPI